MDSRIKKILVVRNDKLGDFMLTWPALSYLKKNLPETKITCLINKEFWPLAELCPFIDDFIIDQNIFVLKKIIHEEQFDSTHKRYSSVTDPVTNLPVKQDISSSLTSEPSTMESLKSSTS